MKNTAYIVTMIAAATLAVAPVAASARPHHSSAGAVIAGLAVGLGIGMIAAAEPAPVRTVVYQQAPVVYQQPAQVVYQQPAPVVYQPAPVVYQPAPVVYQQPVQTVVYRDSVIYAPAPRYRSHHSYAPPRHHYSQPPRCAPPPQPRHYAPPHGGNGLRRR